MAYPTATGGDVMPITPYYNPSTGMLATPPATQSAAVSPYAAPSVSGPFSAFSVPGGYSAGTATLGGYRTPPDYSSLAAYHPSLGGFPTGQGQAIPTFGGNRLLAPQPPQQYGTVGVAQPAGQQAAGTGIPNSYAWSTQLSPYDQQFNSILDSLVSPGTALSQQQLSALYPQVTQMMASNPAWASLSRTAGTGYTPQQISSANAARQANAAAGFQGRTNLGATSFAPANVMGGTVSLGYNPQYPSFQPTGPVTATQPTQQPPAQTSQGSSTQSTDSGYPVGWNQYGQSSTPYTWVQDAAQNAAGTQWLGQMGSNTYQPQYTQQSAQHPATQQQHNTTFGF